MRAVVLLLLVLMSGAGRAGPVVVLRLEGAIGPATADYVHRGLSRAARQDAPLAVIRLDTPGGLDASMRTIIQDILASPVPVAAFVHPTGARAASAGTYILYASHVAAMAPATNLGAATPVQLGGGAREPAPAGKKGAGEESGDAMSRKQVQDAAAYIRGLAQLRGRNAEWAEQAVRSAVSLSAEEALRLKVIDVIAKDVPDLLRQADGRTVLVQGSPRRLVLARAAAVQLEPDWRTRVLSFITDPSLAYILLLLGVYGLFFEFANPGYVLPGVVGTICLLLALFALQMLSVNYAGLALIVLGIAFIVAEAFVPSFGALGLGGVAAFVVGSVMLIDTDVPGYGIPWPLIAGVAVVTGAFLFGIAWMALRARRQPAVGGDADLVGAEGRVVSAGAGELWVQVRGELWRARARTSAAAGERVRVVARNGLTLDVERADRG